VPRRLKARAYAHGRFWGQSDINRQAKPAGSVENDPQETLDVHCGNGFDTGFSPYQSARLKRYNAGRA
jgi:hypothetical protein